jgi:hypothetical protein
MDTIGVSQTDFLSGEISMTFDLEKARDAAKFDDHMAITVKHQGGPPPLGGGRNWVHFPVYFRGALHTYLTCQINLLHVLGHHRHPRGKPLDADPVRLCQTPARKGAVETRFEAVFGRSEANVPARLGPLRFVGACRLAWRSGQISDSETDLLRAAESPSP